MSNSTRIIEFFEEFTGQRQYPCIGAKSFSLSVGSQIFFAVGFHPGASKEARRSRRAAIVFNLNDQFERLLAVGNYENMRAKILQRDNDWTGSINPMLGIHGSVSEARQYSGRQVDDNWQCPFKLHRLQTDGLRHVPDEF